MKIFHGRPQGFYIRSSSGCGEDSAIRLYYVDECEQTVYFAMSPEEAIALADNIIRIAKKYIEGDETMHRETKLVFDTDVE